MSRIPSETWVEFCDVGKRGDLPKLQKLCAKHLDDHPEVLIDTLNSAVRNDQVETVGYLLESHAGDLSASSLGKALSCAIGDFRFNMSRKLIESALVDLNEPLDLFGDTPLLKAVRLGFDQIVECLLDHGAPVDQQARPKAAVTKSMGGDTPLIIAVLENRIRVMEILLRRGADANLVGREGKTALDRAGRSAERKAIRKLLKEHGAKTGRELHDAEPKRKTVRRKAKRPKQTATEKGQVANTDPSARLELGYFQIEGESGAFVTLEPTPPYRRTPHLGAPRSRQQLRPL